MKAANGEGEEEKKDEPASVPEKPDENAAAAQSEEPEHVPTYVTEKKHQSVNQFKKSMNLFVDNYKLNYATTNFSL